MNKTVVGAILLFLIMVVAAVAVKMITPYLADREQINTSDAANTKGTIRVDLDNWTGYYPLRSEEMKKRLRHSGYLLEVRDDKADYKSRMQRLANGESDFAVATVDSYILNGIADNFPGTIIMVIDESRGGDAILARKGKIDSLDKMKSLREVKVAFTPASPSHHLAKAASYHFGVKPLLPTGGLRIETGGSEEACDLLLAGKTDVAVCWEPDVSRALNSGDVIKLLGTEETRKLIVDILLVNRRVAAKKPEMVEFFVESYFDTRKFYRSNPEKLVAELKDDTGLSKKMVDAMLKGVAWAGFEENCGQWFGISGSGSAAGVEDGLVNTIESTIRILLNTGDFSTNPIPAKDPGRLINSRFLKKIHTKRFTGFTAAGATGTAADTLTASFSRIGKHEWAALKAVGTLRVDPVTFQRGTSDLDMVGQQVINAMVEKLRHYPTFRIKINAHTGIRGDKKANKELSQMRADSVRAYLQKNYGINPNRILATGFGGENPLEKQPGESRRSWLYRLPRVEIELVREVF